MTDYDPTPEQTAVLGHSLEECARLLAGPGTGKSATVVELVTQLLARDRPPRIRLLTFTRAATAELARKVAEQPALTVERPSTIHSFAISALLSNPGCADFPSPLRIPDPWEMRNIVEPGLAARTGVTPTVVRRKLIPEMAANWEALEPQPRDDIDEHLRNRFLGVWDEHRRIFGYTLLAELPDLLRRALETHADLEKLDFDMLVVDEYQDLNACDLSVLHHLASQGTAVFAVGDDEQSIYSFRRAAPEGIRRFPSDYPGCADYTLSVSHRCGSAIIAWARHVIESSPTRDPGRPRLVSADGAAVGEAALLSFRSNQAEAKGVASIVNALIEREGLSPNDILILFRGDHNGIFSAPVKAELEKRGVPVDDPSVVETILATPENRRTILLLRLLVNREDSLAWAGLIALEPGLGDAFTSSIYDGAREHRTNFARALLDGFRGEFEDARGNRDRALDLVTRTIAWLDENEPPAVEDAPDGWGEWIIEALSADQDLEATDALADMLSGVDEIVEPGLPLDRYLGLLETLAIERAQSYAAGVRFMTMVSSKGLTVEAAIVVGAEEGIMPRPDADTEEERRLLYVAMTRARRFQYVTWATRRTGPTARAGAPRVGARRTESRFLRNGPVATQDGTSYIAERWPAV